MTCLKPGNMDKEAKSGCMNGEEEQQGNMRRGVEQKGRKGLTWRAEKDEREREREIEKAIELKRGKQEEEREGRKITIF